MHYITIPFHEIISTCIEYILRIYIYIYWILRINDFEIETGMNREF